MIVAVNFYNNNQGTATTTPRYKLVVHNGGNYTNVPSGTVYTIAPELLQDTVLKRVFNKTTGVFKIGCISQSKTGLKSSDIIRTEDGAVAGGYHPAFRQLVEAEIAKEDLEAQIAGVREGEFLFCTNPVSFSNMVGQKKSNRIYFSEKYPGLRIRYAADASVKPRVYRAMRIQN